MLYIVRDFNESKIVLYVNLYINIYDEHIDTYKHILIFNIGFMNMYFVCRAQKIL